MFLGVLFILAGVLIAVFPPLLSLIVASVLIFTGICFLYLGYYWRKGSYKVDDPFINFFFRL